MASKEIIDLTGDSDDEKRPAKKQKTDEPRWKGKTGTARMMSEFRSLRREWGDSPKLLSLETVDDQMNLWRLKVNDFDNDSAGGRQLNADLEKLRSRSHNFIELEISFPADYPTSPFFLRLIAPRMMWYTGHVTAGGAICIEALTNSGTPHSWSADLSVETILRTVFNNMCHAEIGHVRLFSALRRKKRKEFFFFTFFFIFILHFISFYFIPP